MFASTRKAMLERDAEKRAPKKVSQTETKPKRRKAAADK